MPLRLRRREDKATPMVRFSVKLAAVVWASPYSLVGLVIGALGLLSGGRASVRDGILEFSGGAVSWFVKHLPSGPTTLAITLGHVVLGQTQRHSTSAANMNSCTSGNTVAGARCLDPPT